MKQYELGRWDLSDLYSGIEGDDFKDAMRLLGEKADALATVRPELNDETSSDRLREILVQLAELHELANRLGSFCEMLFSGDSQNTKIMAANGKVDSLIADASNKILFINLWWKSLSDELAEKHLVNLPEYRYYLTQIRQTKPYTLSEKEEQLCNLKDVNGVTKLRTIYNTITNRYTFDFEVDGEMKKLTRGQLSQYFRDANPEIRRKAYDELYRVYANDGAILTQLYQGVVGNWDSEAQFRGYTSPIVVMNTANDIPDSVVDLLLETTQKNKHVFQRYFTLKKKLLGLDEMSRTDIYAPVMKSDKTYSFHEGVETVRAAFDSFDPKFTEMAMRVFNENHIDSEVRPGKRDGAYCLTVCPSLTPYVLVNYQGKLDDISTLAHELGHGIHSMSAEKQNIFQQHACLPLAETASTFCEMVLSEYLKNRESDPLVKRTILMDLMDGNYATIQRQAYFALFEREAHAIVANGGDTDALNDAYLANLRDQFGDAVKVPENFKWEWAVIPHIFYTPFYVYAYAFGQLLVLALFRAYKQEGKSFIPKMHKLLSTGGSLPPAEVLKNAGFDFTDPAFWQGGFDVMSEIVDEIESLS